MPLPKFLQGKFVQHQDTEVCQNFKNDLSIDVGVVAPETAFFAIFPMYNFENLLLKNYYTEFNESWLNCFLDYPTQNEYWDF